MPTAQGRQWYHRRALVAAAPMPILPGLIAAALQIVGPVVMARMLGLLVREHSQELFGA